MEIYDTTVCLSDPYKSYSFQPAGSIEIAQSLAFGTSGWGKMTAYCLTKGGNVYSLSPVIPASFNCTLIDRDSLVSDVEEFMRSSQTDPLIKEQYSLQKQFLQDIANNPQQWSNMNTLLRGPYRMAPAPYEIEFDDEACDMISVTLTQSGKHLLCYIISFLT